MILVGHGAAARDCPRELVSRWKALESARRAKRHPPSAEELELDQKIRAWPRTPATDPYAAGLEALGEALRARLKGVEVLVAYNEFCAPSLEEALVRVLEAGKRRVWVISSMPTPGGVHAEHEIPESIESVRAAWPSATISYAWPFAPELVAEFFAAQLERSGFTVDVASACRTST